MVAKGKLVELAKHFNKSHHYAAKKAPLMDINRHKEHMRIVDAAARREAEEHRRHRKAQREEVIADGN